MMYLSQIKIQDLGFLSEFEPMLIIKCFFLALCATVASSIPIEETKTCLNNKSPSFLKILKCPTECPSTAPNDLNAKPCYIDCDTPVCKAECKTMTFYDQHDDDHFSLVSDVNFQISARFAGLIQGVRTRDFSRIQALGVLFNHNKFSVEVTRAAASCNDAIKHLKFSYNGDEVIVAKGHLSRWESSDSELIVEGMSEANSVLITVSDFAEISVRVVHVPNENCCGHIEAGFKFYGLSSNAEGVLGRTPTGVAMQLIGGEEEYRTASLLSPECSSCRYFPAEDNVFSIMEQGTMEYGGGRKQLEWNVM